MTNDCSNREYLAQRHYSVVLYLNDAGRDFDGGIFQFFDEEVRVVALCVKPPPASIVIQIGQGTRVQEEVLAVAGRALIFTSGPENMHGITPVTRGER